VDAVEVPSRFVRDALLPHTLKEVTVTPHPVVAPARRKTTYAANGVLHCLYMFSMASGFERKNPLAALRAFALAFPEGKAELSFKVSDVSAAQDVFRNFAEACSKVRGVRILTETMSREALSELYLEHDVYLSLHRSEGYGLTIQEAMQHGLHAVATGWSGNMEFMQGPLAHPVPYTLIPVGADGGAYKGLHAEWAEADVEACAVLLRQLHRQLTENRVRA